MLYSDPVTIDERTTPTKGLSQAYALRDVAYQLALKLGMKPSDLESADSERARSVTALIKAWAEADDRIRIHRGKPLPGSLRPAPKAPKKNRSPQSLEPLGRSKKGSGVKGLASGTETQDPSSKTLVSLGDVAKSSGIGPDITPNSDTPEAPTVTPNPLTD